MKRLPYLFSALLLSGLVVGCDLTDPMGDGWEDGTLDVEVARYGHGTELEKIQDNLAKIAEKAVQVERSVRQNDYKALQTYNTELQGVVQSLQRELQNSQRNTAKWRNDALDAQQSLSQALIRASNLQSQVTQLQGQLAGKDRHIQLLQQQVNLLQTHNTSLLLINQQLMTLLLQRESGGINAPVDPVPPSSGGRYRVTVTNEASTSPNVRNRAFWSGLRVLVYGYQRDGTAIEKWQTIERGESVSLDVPAGAQVWVTALMKCNGNFNKPLRLTGMGDRDTVTAKNGKAYPATMARGALDRNISITLTRYGTAGVRGTVR